MSKRTKNLTICALLTALSCAIMYISSVIPSARIAAVAVSGLCSAAAVIHCGRGPSAAVFAASALLSALIVPDKGNVLMYCAFLGYYPIVKSFFEKADKAAVCWGLKLALFNIVFIALWFLALGVLFPDIEPSAYIFAGAFAAANVIFVVYDIGLSRLISYYIHMVSRHIDR